MPILFILLALLSVSACTSLPITQQSEHQIKEAVNWIEANSNLKAPTSRRPAIFTTSKAELVHYRNGKRTAAALYDPIRNVIILQEDWDATDCKDVGLLIHEVVHWMEFKAVPYTVFACREDAEANPYRLQLLYYKEKACNASYPEDLIKKLTTCKGG